jgi:dipeptidyl aminopeptidase/acylaminoacyl peptidase
VPPTLVMHGDAHQAVPYPPMMGFVESLRKAGVDATLLTAEGMGHTMIKDPNAVPLEFLLDEQC